MLPWQITLLAGIGKAAATPGLRGTRLRVFGMHDDDGFPFELNMAFFFGSGGRTATLASQGEDGEIVGVKGPPLVFRAVP